MYFQQFPKLLYPYNVKNKEEYRIVTDITRNMRVIKEVLSNVTIYDEYDILDGESVEIIADRVYGSPFYHWIIMIVNEKYDYKNDYPLTIDELEKHIEQKYGYTTITFDASSPFSVSVPNNIIIINGHNLSTGDAIIYDSNGGTPIGGLVNNKQYYVIRIDDDKLALATSRQNALSFNRIDFTSIGSDIHSIKLNNQYNVHHYEDGVGFVVNEVNENVYGESFPGYPVSNYEYEVRENEKKRRIKLISPGLMSTILKNFDDGI